MKKRKDTNEKKREESAAFHLLLAQTIVCVLAVLLIWLMTVIGGKESWFGEVCREGLYDNGLLDGVSQRLYGTTVTMTTTVQPIKTEMPAITTATNAPTGDMYADH